MTRESSHDSQLIDLGSAAEETLGAKGTMIDFVAYLETSGISDDD